MKTVTTSKNYLLRYADFWNPNKVLSVSDFLALRKWIKDTYPDFYQNLDVTIDFLDSAYLNIVILPNPNLYPALLKNLEALIDSLKSETSFPDPNDERFATALYNRAPFLKWMIEENSQ